MLMDHSRFGKVNGNTQTVLEIRKQENADQYTKNNKDGSLKSL